MRKHIKRKRDRACRQIGAFVEDGQSGLADAVAILVEVSPWWAGWKAVVLVRVAGEAAIAF